MDLTTERKAEIRSWIEDILRDPACIFLDTATETELAAIDFMIIYYQKELTNKELAILNPFPRHCIFCALARNCSSCVWRLEQELQSTKWHTCALWQPEPLLTFPALLCPENKEFLAARIAMLYRWRTELLATLPDGKIYCGECFKETFINRIEITERDSAFGYAESFRSYEYLSGCCSDDRFYSNAACTLQFSPAEIAELWQSANN